MGPGGAGYSWSKQTLVGYAQQMAVQLAPTAFGQCGAPDELQHPPHEQRGHLPSLPADIQTNRSPRTTSGWHRCLPRTAHTLAGAGGCRELVLFLASDASKYMTGASIPIDAGCMSSGPTAPGSERGRVGRGAQPSRSASVHCVTGSSNITALGARSTSANSCGRCPWSTPHGASAVLRHDSHLGPAVSGAQKPTSRSGLEPLSAHSDRGGGSTRVGHATNAGSACRDPPRYSARLVDCLRWMQHAMQEMLEAALLPSTVGIFGRAGGTNRKAENPNDNAGGKVVIVTGAAGNRQRHCRCARAMAPPFMSPDGL